MSVPTQEGASLVILDLIEKILFLVTHEGVILVLWTRREVLDDSNSLRESFSICDLLGSWWMVLTHERVSLVTSNLLGDAFRILLIHWGMPLESLCLSTC